MLTRHSNRGTLTLEELAKWYTLYSGYSHSCCAGPRNPIPIGCYLYTLSWEADNIKFKLNKLSKHSLNYKNEN